jgi:hypothetical protein
MISAATIRVRIVYTLKLNQLLIGRQREPVKRDQERAKLGSVIFE